MKKLAIMVALSLLLIAVMATGVGAQGTVTYSVGVQIKNMDAQNRANVTVTYYDQNGNAQPVFTVVDPNDGQPGIPAGKSFTMATLQGVSEGFNGSAVISSNTQVAAIANVFGNQAMGASYTALSAGDTSANLPLILRNHYGFNTWFNVQNAGSADTNVTVTYSNGATETATIKPGAAKTFNNANNTELTDPAGDAGFVGSAIVTSSGSVPIVATLMQQGPTTLLGYDGFRSTDGTTNPVMPLVNANNFGFDTGIQIQNLGSQATVVTVSYTPSQAGTACTEQQTIPANGSATFAIDSFRESRTGENCADGATFVGSARVSQNSTSQPLVAIVNQLNSAAQKGASYGGFNAANATSTVELPLIMDRNYGYWTGFAIANVGQQSTTITCTYTNSSHTDSATVPAGGALTVQNKGQLADAYVGAATCTATGGDAKIVGVVNELGDNSTSDSFLVYEGAGR